MGGFGQPGAAAYRYEIMRLTLAQFDEQETVRMIDFAESREIEALFKKVQRYGITPENCIGQPAGSAELSPANDAAPPPEFMIRKNGEKIPVYSALEILSVIKEAGHRGLSIQRYKGLGEMNPEQLWETTMNPERRTILQVNLEDAVAAEDTFNNLMGEKVEPRREFIEAHALEVRNLDI